jgi:hypothetical protein
MKEESRGNRKRTAGQVGGRVQEARRHNRGERSTEAADKGAAGAGDERGTERSSGLCEARSGRAQEREHAQRHDEEDLEGRLRGVGTGDAAGPEAELRAEDRGAAHGIPIRPALTQTGCLPVSSPNGFFSWRQTKFPLLERFGPPTEETFISHKRQKISISLMRRGLAVFRRVPESRFLAFVRCSAGRNRAAHRLAAHFHPTGETIRWRAERAKFQVCVFFGFALSNLNL